MKKRWQIFGVSLILVFATGVVIGSPTLALRMHKDDPAFPEHRYVWEVEIGSVGPYVEGDFFKSFCIETDELTADGQLFYATISDIAWRGGEPAGDPLDPMTAFLYTQFTRGALMDYGYDYADMDSFEALQDVIWHIEQESGCYMSWPGDALRQALYASAVEATTPGDDGQTTWAGIGNVRVMVMTDRYGRCRQDHLVLIPAPAALLLGSIGLGIVGWLRRGPGILQPGCGGGRSSN